MPAYRPNKQAHLTSLQSRVPQLSPRPSRRLRIQRTALLVPAPRRVALQHRAMMCLVLRALRRRPVRHVRQGTWLNMKARLVHRPPGRPRLDLRMHRMPRPLLRSQRRARRTHHAPSQRLDPKVRLIRRPRLGQQHPVRRTRLDHKQRLDPRMRLTLNRRLIRRLLLDLRLSPIQRRKSLVLKNGDPSSKTGAFYHTARSPRYEPRFLAQASQP